MEIDKSRLEKIGIDRVVINNFKIHNFEELERKEVNSAFEYIEKFEARNHLFNLNYSVNLRADNEIYTISNLEINPSKILYNHNIYTADTQELKKALEVIVKILQQKGIDIDLTEAKIKEVEINMTFEQEFKELEEVLLLIGRANYQKALGLYSFNEEDIPARIKTERSLYINSKMPDHRKENTGKVIKFYDKTFELLRNHDMDIEEPLTRIEVLLGRDYYRSKINALGFGNSLRELISNNHILEILFKDSLGNEVKTKPSNYLENVLKKNLVYDFLNFKRNEKEKAAKRIELKKSGKKIPEYLKEERGVFEYLHRNSWIFDFSYLVEIVRNEDCVRISNRWIYEKQIKKKYLNKNNKEIYKKILEKITR